MHKTLRAAASALAFSVLALTLWASPQQPGARSRPGTLVIVFRDGHRQTIQLADIARMEFSGSADVAAGGLQAPSRAHFLGRWEVGEGNGENFYITLRDDGTAFRSLRDVHGTWQYANGEAQIRWDDGSQDAIRKVGSSFKKCWYKDGRPFSEEPDNITNARNLSQNPGGVD